MTRRQVLLKRAFDVVGSVVGLVALSPVILFLMVVVKLTSPGPALYCQVRIGRHGTPFEMLKLRSMRHSLGEEGSHITVAHDSRVTSFGALLRRYKLDELPQVWNVLKGEMSFVGPRPDVPGYADQLRGEARRLLELRPGITGPATLYFRYEEELLSEVVAPVEHNDQVLFPIKTRLNREYLDSWSFWRDLGYLLITIVPAANRWLRLVPERNTLDALTPDD